MDFTNKKLYIVAGPTAVGKTNFAINLAKKIDGEIISADAIQVYKGLDIGSAKITEEEKQGIKHYLIDIVNFDYNFDIADFVHFANKALNEIYSKGKIPIVVGGTGFYIHALLYGNEFSEEDENKKITIRTELYDLKQKYGIEYIYNKLKEVDIESYNKIHINNEKRVIRALEYYLLNNKKISEHNIEQKEMKSKFDYKFYCLDMDRDKLYERIDLRVDLMIQNGLLEEIASLIKNGCKKEYRSMQAIGYKEFYDYVYDNMNFFDGEHFNKNIYESTELNNLIEFVKKNSRNYAKRQLTWFRREQNVEYIER